MPLIKNYIKDALIGVAVGDSLGVPVEFTSREKLQLNPVINMRDYGTYDVPPGTWSDDTSLTLCLADALCYPFSLQKIADNFIAWLYNNYWTATGTVFDVGITTQNAIQRLLKGIRPDLAGGFYESENGNGSLMRMLPLIFYTSGKPIEERYELTKQVSSITHGHVRSIMACFYYLEFARLLLQAENPVAAYMKLQSDLSYFFNELNINSKELALFNRLLKENISELNEDDIQSTGYVIHTLEAAIWCLLTTSNYKDAVLKAVNLGNDTDTTSAVCGGLAGLIYGHQSIPEEWLNTLARSKDICHLADTLANQLATY